MKNENGASLKQKMGGSKFTGYLIISVAMLACGLALSIRSNVKTKRERDDYRSDRHSLLENVAFYRTKDSLSTASVERLMLTKRELERYNTELVSTVKSLGIKIKRLKAAATTAIRTGIDISAPLRDTVIVVKSEPVLAQTFRWSDTWVSISGTLTGASVNCRVHSRDTLVQAIHRVPHKFLCFRWGTKAIRQEIVSRNPNSEIVYTEYVELK